MISVRVSQDYRYHNMNTVTTRSTFNKGTDFTKSDKEEVLGFQDLLKILIKSNSEKEMMNAITSSKKVIANKKESLKPMNENKQEANNQIDNDSTSEQNHTVDPKVVEAMSLKLSCKLLGINEKDILFF